MALDPAHVGRRYGPFTYEAGLEKLREFSLAVGGGVPSTGFSAQPPPATLHPWLYDRQAARASKYADVIAMPTFAVTFAIGPFASACHDPAVGVDLLMLVHGEQEFEFFAAVKPGDVLTTTGEIAEIKSKSGFEFLVVTTHSVNQHGHDVVKGRWTAVVRAS